MSVAACPVDDATDREPMYGDSWQAAELDGLVKTLRRNGYEVIDGTLDHGGLSVRTPRGARSRIDLLSPGVLRATAEDHADDVPSDQFPAIPSPVTLFTRRLHRGTWTFTGTPIHAER